MKKYRNDERVELQHPYSIEEVGLLVWLGSSEYWSKVYLNKKDNRLYVKTGRGKFELLDTFNIRKAAPYE